jgi:hypothetical protein
MDHKALILIALLCATPAQAQLVGNSCVSACLAQGSVYTACINRCNSPAAANVMPTLPVPVPETVPDSADDRMRAKQLESQKIENDKQKIELKKQQHECVASCIKGGKNEHRCRLTCDPDTNTGQ